MAVFEDDARPKPAAHIVGEELTAISEAELAERIQLLQAEIKRIEEVLASKRASRLAAAAHFKS